MKRRKEREEEQERRYAEEEDRELMADLKVCIMVHRSAASILIVPCVLP